MGRGRRREDESEKEGSEKRSKTLVRNCVPKVATVSRSRSLLHCSRTRGCQARTGDASALTRARHGDERASGQSAEALLVRRAQPSPRTAASRIAPCRPAARSATSAFIERGDWDGEKGASPLSAGRPRVQAFAVIGAPAR